jgi:hypothetical protein
MFLIRTLGYLLIFLISLFSCDYLLNQAEAFNLVQLDEVRVEYQNYIFHRHPLFTEIPGKESLNLGLKVNLLDTMYWDTLVHSTTTSAQYHLVGLEMKFGIRIYEYLEVEYKHHSQHLLDTTYQYMKFPVEDSIGVNLYLYRRDKHRESIF